MPVIGKISIKGFKSIGDVDRLELHPINVLIGPNGSGKSNFIEAFSFLHEIREGRLQEYIGRSGGAEKLLHFGSKRTRQLKIHIWFGDAPNEYEIILIPANPDYLIPLSERIYYRRPDWINPKFWNLVRQGNEAGISQVDQRPVGQYVRSHLNRWRKYHFHDTSSDSLIRKTADVNDNRFLRFDGSNLAAFLYYLHLKHGGSYDLIRRSVRLVAPFFDDFVLQPQALNEETIRLEWRHKRSDAYFDASSFSDGSLRFVALATLLLQPDQHLPSAILLDEPEIGLHPYAITMLASLIKQASARTQIILSTQSSLLLDQFEPEDVLVAERESGGTKLTRLDKADLEEWLQDYSLGQLWEKNDIGGRPVPEGAGEDSVQ